MTTHFNLKPVQVEILRLAANGLVYKQIADRMNLKYRTVTNQIDIAIKSTGCTGCVHLVHKLTKSGVI
jgi:DNA-binding CsgD family transcriptional regulator